MEVKAENTLEKARIQVKIKQTERKIKHKIEGKTVSTQVLEMYKNFDALVFNISRIDKITSTDELKKMNIYDFYRHKELLEEEVKRNNKNGSESI